jgi:hypothetical protein
MQKFGFKGFTQGSTVALNVSQNGQTRSESVQAWGVNANATVEIELSLPQTLTAPAQVWVKATNISGLTGFNLTGLVYRGAFHEYFYYWEVRGQPLAAFSSPENMISEWNNPNVSNAQEAAFCLTTPGNYYIDLIVIDRTGGTAVASTQQITVIDADDQYPNDRTVCVSFDGIFTDKPAGAREATSLADIDQKIRWDQTNINTRLLFRRGEVFNDFVYAFIERFQCSYIGSFGPLTAKPVLRAPLSNSLAVGPQSTIEFLDHMVDQYSGVNGKTITVTGLKFQNDWDTESETGSIGLARCVGMRQSNFTNVHFTVHDCEFRDVGVGVTFGNTLPAVTDNKYMVSDCSIIGWKEYGMFILGADTDKVAVIGSRITQPPNALLGGPKFIGPLNQHGPTRFADVLGVYFAMNDVFSCTGWSGLSQQCLRLATSAIADQWTFTDRNVMEGGYLMVSLEGQNRGEADLPGNHMVQRNLMIASAENPLSFVASHKGGTTIRGNYGYLPASTYVNAGSQPQSSFSFIPSNSLNDNNDEPMAVYSNTSLVLRDEMQSFGQTYLASRFEGFNNFVDENNVFHMPNRDTPSIASAPIDTTSNIAGVTLRYNGPRSGFIPIIATLPTGGIAPGASWSIPYTGMHQTLCPTAGTTFTVNVGGNTDTNQAYWQSLGVDDVRHTLTVVGIGYMTQHNGEFTVSFADATNMLITNNTSLTWGVDGPSASLGPCTINMHRNSKIPARNTALSQSGQSVPLPVPSNDTSPAWQSASGAFVAPRDFLDGLARTAPISQGAMSP